MLRALTLSQASTVLPLGPSSKFTATDPLIPGHLSPHPGGKVWRGPFYFSCIPIFQFGRAPPPRRLSMLAARTGWRGPVGVGSGCLRPRRPAERAGGVWLPGRLPGPRAPVAESPRGGLRLGKRAPRLPAGRAASGRCAGLRGARPAGGGTKGSPGREGALRAVRRGLAASRRGKERSKGAEVSRASGRELRGAGAGPRSFPFFRGGGESLSPC